MIQSSSPQDSQRVHALLREYNRGFWRDMRNYSFHIEEEGRLVAGIVAGSTFCTLEVEFLFVEESRRGKGYGRRLLRHAEETARQDGMTQALVNTYSFQAPGFYEKEGYSLLLRIDRAIGEYDQYFFRKAL